MKVEKNFTLAEFVHPEILDRWGAKALWFIDPKIFTIAQAIRDRFNRPVTINDWITGGLLVDSGLRQLNCQIGATLSQHKFGRAIDFRVDGIDPLEVQQDIKNFANYYQLAGMTTIEDSTPTWTHADCRQTNSNEIFLIQTKYSKTA